MNKDVPYHSKAGRTVWSTRFSAKGLGLIPDADSPYSARFAVALCLFLSAVLWWVPIIGPAVAGYIGGRRAGSAPAGAICTLASGAALLSAVLIASHVVLSSGGFPEVSAEAAAASLTGISGYFGSYLQIFFSDGTSSIDLSGLGIVFVFGIAGGVMSGQARKETSYLLKLGSTEGSLRPSARSMELYRRGKKPGFECFNDYIFMQGMMTNKNPDQKNDANREGKEISEDQPRASEQTVTTTVSDRDSDDSGRNPFSDILKRSELRKSSKAPPKEGKP
jgi:hypothetical protein